MAKKLPLEIRKCAECGSEFQIERYKKNKHCSRRCAGVSGRRKYMVDRNKNCAFCGKHFVASDNRVKCCGHSCARKLTIRENPNTLDNFFKARDESAKRPEVIKERSDRFRRMWADEKYREENRIRMTENNPTWQEGVVEKIIQTAKESGYDYSHLNGGNGTESKYERMLKDALPDEWQMQFVYVTSEQDRQDGSPNHYKIDLALERVKLAVEVDGRSHELKDRQAQDAKKTRILNRAGWEVVRVKNADVIDNLPGVLSRISEAVSKRKA